MIIRDYQKEAVEALWDEILVNNTALLVGSCGLGKTVILIEFIKKCINKFPQLKCLFLVNKVNLLEQTHERFKQEFDVGIYCGSKGEKNTNKQVTIATIQSIHKQNTSFNLICIDECHAVDCGNGTYYEYIKKMSEINSKIKIVAVTATAFRSNGYIYGPGKIFKRICFEKGLLWSIENKFLVMPRIKRMEEHFDTSNLRTRMGEWAKEDVEELTSDETKLRKQLADAIPRLVDRKKIIWACSSINHAEMLNNALLELKENSTIIHSKNDNSLDEFKHGDKRHLVFVSIISEGIDIPCIDAVVLMRPTKSPVYYVQVIGRGLRIFPEKEDCIVLDYGNVVENCGPINDPFIKSSSSRLPDKSDTKFCKKCLEYLHKKEETCTCCGHKEVKEERNSIPRLSNTAYSNPVIYRNQLNSDDLYRVERVISARYTSKSGNKCLKFSYFLKPYEIINEFFSENSSYFLNKRMKFFGINIYNDAEEKLYFDKYIVDKDLFVTLERDGKYWKIKEMKQILSKAS